MPGNNMLKKEILMQIGNLPDTKMPELLDFIKFLNFQRRTVLKNKSTEGKNLLNEDPMDEFIGGAEHGSLARGIDRELYE